MNRYFIYNAADKCLWIEMKKPRKDDFFGTNWRIPFTESMKAYNSRLRYPCREDLQALLKHDQRVREDEFEKRPMWEKHDRISPMQYEAIPKQEKYLSGYSKKAIEENSKHTCPYTHLPCESLACSVRVNGICNILEVMKHDPKPEQMDDIVGTFEFDHEKQTETYTPNPNFGKPEQKENELENLREWKRQALSVMPDFQKIGELIGVKPGDSVHDKIVPYLEKQKEERRFSLDEMRDAFTHCYNTGKVHPNNNRNKDEREYFLKRFNINLNK